jgi:N4-gp56 family major capsid protein
MAQTAFATNNALTKKVWEEKLFRDSVKESYFSKFMGQDQSSLVYVKTQLEKGQGDTVYFGLRMRLTGAGVEDEQTLEGNEEALSTYDYSLALKEYAHAVRDKGALSRKRAMFSIDTESKQALQDWGSEKVDQLAFDALLTTPTKTLYLDSSAVFQGDTAANAKAGLHATNSKITPNFISAAKTWAKTGGNRAYIPIRPVKVQGKEYFILLVHPDCMYDLKANSTFQQAMREAEVRGPSNPLFTGAAAIYDGVVIHEHENCTLGTDGGASGNVAWAKCALMGQQSLCWAWGARPSIVQETFDYQRQHGYAWSMIARCGKPQFNSLDYGSLGVYLARTQISDN